MKRVFEQSEEWMYIAASMAMNPNNYISICHTDHYEHAEDGISDPLLNDYIPADEYSLNPEQVLLKKEAMLTLSGEANFIIKMIITSPLVVSRDLGIDRRFIIKEKSMLTAGGKITPKSIRVCLRKTFKWPNKKIDEVFSEIKDYINTL